MDSTHVKGARGGWRVGAGDGGAARRVPAIVVLVVAMGLALLPASSSSSAHSTWVVDVDTVLPAAARVIGELPFIDSLIVSSPTAISGAAPLDTPLTTQSLTAESVGEGVMPTTTSVVATGAPAVWSQTLGQGAVVALIDTGVHPVPALEGAVAGEIDFTGSGGGDGYGHGTFLASIIAGRPNELGTDPAAGVAPLAGILSLKVGDNTGASTLGTVLGALQWLYGPGSSNGIRIATLALSVDAGTEAADVLDLAVDRLAERGVLVVTASGNHDTSDGSSAEGALTSPATATTTLSVGATDDAHELADFSSGGVDRNGLAQPDVLAPGVDVLGSLPPGSFLATVDGAPRPVAEGTTTLYRGSGTSMATAMAAGVAALVSDVAPSLSGPQIAQAITSGDANPTQLDAASAVAAAREITGDRPGQSNDRGNGADNGTANGNRPVDGPGSGNGNGNGLGNGGGIGNADPQSIRWGSIRWGSIRWGSIRWGSIRWGAAEWNGSGWGSSDWEAANWGSIRWGGAHWAYDGPEPASIRWGSIRWAGLS